MTGREKAEEKKKGNNGWWGKGGKKKGKELHIISTGVSLLENAKREGLYPQNVSPADEDFWDKILSDSTEIQKLKDFVAKNPRKYSAELNTFLRVVEGKEPKNIWIYLFGTATKSNELARRVISLYLRERGFNLYDPHDVPGYFWEERNFDSEYAKDEFQRGISVLLDRLIYIARKKKEEGYEVFFNPTGGFKAHVIATALAGFLTDSPVYYMHEEFKDVIFFPKMFYLPKGKEIELLKMLSDGEPRSGKEFEKLQREYGEEIERLELYGLVDVKRNEFGEPFRIIITSKGSFILKEIEGV